MLQSRNAMVIQGGKRTKPADGEYRDDGMIDTNHISHHHEE
jgi:hypothetical protein